NGANVKAKTKYNESVLHKAASSSDSTGEMGALLVQLGVSTADEDDFGSIPLQRAAHYNVQVFTALLEHGANPAMHSDRRTPLIDAVISGNAKVVTLCLSQYEGDLNALDCFGMSVFDHLGQLKPSVAQDLGFPSSLWSAYRPTEPAERRAHVLASL